MLPSMISLLASDVGERFSVLGATGDGVSSMQAASRTTLAAATAVRAFMGALLKVIRGRLWCGFLPRWGCTN
jgi:hypothetical protein